MYMLEPVIESMKPLQILIGHEADVYFSVNGHHYAPECTEVALFREIILWGMVLTGQLIQQITVCVPGIYICFEFRKIKFIARVNGLDPI